MIRGCHFPAYLWVTIIFTSGSHLVHSSPWRRDTGKASEGYTMTPPYNDTTGFSTMTGDGTTQQATTYQDISTAFTTPDDTTVSQSTITPYVPVSPISTQCGGDYYDPQGVIYSPLYPNYYPRIDGGYTCTYVINITNPKMKYITVNFELFDLGGGTCLEDYLAIRHGISESSPLFDVYCGGDGRQPPPLILTGETDGLYMEFRSSDELTTDNWGFKALYQMTENITTPGVSPMPNIGQCGGAYSLPDTRHDGFGSPRHPDLYPPDSNCVYFIQAQENHNIELVFTAFEVERDSDCTFDSVLIEEGKEGIVSATELGTYCGSFINGTGYPPPTLVRTSKNNYARVTFTSDNMDQFTGFYAQFKEVDESKEMEQTTISICNDVRSIVTDRGGLIVSHSGYDDGDNYPNEDNVCVMRIQSDPKENDIIYVDLDELDLRPSSEDCNPIYDDALVIYDPVIHRIIATMCSGSGNFESSEGTLELYFYTHYHEDGGNYDGFKVIYTAFRLSIGLCQLGEFYCRKDNWCIAGYLECDGYEHCRDGYDEGNCSGPAYVWLVTLLILLIFLIAVIIFVWAYDKCTKSQTPYRERPSTTRRSTTPTTPATVPVPPPYSEEPPQYNEIYENGAFEMTTLGGGEGGGDEEEPPSYAFALEHPEQRDGDVDSNADSGLSVNASQQDASEFVDDDQHGDCISDNIGGSDQMPIDNPCFVLNEETNQETDTHCLSSSNDIVDVVTSDDLPSDDLSPEDGDNTMMTNARQSEEEDITNA